MSIASITVMGTLEKRHEEIYEGRIELTKMTSSQEEMQATYIKEVSNCLENVLKRLSRGRHLC